MTLFHYNFYPVGQGLFSSGHLARDRQNDFREFVFNWVYDCGTKSSRSLLSDGMDLVERFVRSGHNSKRIELLALSHFDEDHINGVVQLLGRVKVHTLLLPYVPLHQRIELAFDLDVDPWEALFGFFIDPVQYIVTNVPEGAPDQILFVPPAGPEDTVGTGEGGTTPGDNDPYQPLFDARDPSEPDENALANSASARTRVSFLGRRSTIRVRGFWEFVPYNDAEFAPTNSAFIREVEDRRDELLAATEEDDRETILADLKRIYRKVYPAGTKANVISLFLYAGPIPSGRTDLWHLTGSFTMDEPGPWFPYWWDGPWHPRFHHHWPLHMQFPHTDKRPAILYTGDGFLNTADRLTRLCRYLTDERVRSIGCLQVMHHGSRLNWHPGVTDRITPWLSVFPADPKPDGHPHAEVVQAFWPFGAANVDRRNGSWSFGIVDN